MARYYLPCTAFVTYVLCQKFFWKHMHIPNIGGGNTVINDGMLSSMSVNYELTCAIVTLCDYRQVSNKTHQFPTLKRFSYCLAATFAESFEARRQVENEDVVGAAPTGDAPTTSEWLTILLPTAVRLILEVLRYIHPMYRGHVKPAYAYMSIEETKGALGTLS